MLMFGKAKSEIRRHKASERVASGSKKTETLCHVFRSNQEGERERDLNLSDERFICSDGRADATLAFSSTSSHAYSTRNLRFCLFFIGDAHDMVFFLVGFSCIESEIKSKI